MTALFMTLEGIEGVGKSTLRAGLEQWFAEQKVPVTFTREPGGTPLGEKVRQLLLSNGEPQMHADSELLLMFAARAEHLRKVIAPALAAGRSVLSDRYVDASYAYQGGGRGIAVERIAILESWLQPVLQPTLTFLLDMPVAEARLRVQNRGADTDRFEQEQVDFFARVQQAYYQRAQAYPERFVLLDATQTPQMVLQQATTVIHARLIS